MESQIPYILEIRWNLYGAHKYAYPWVVRNICIRHFLCKSDLRDSYLCSPSVFFQQDYAKRVVNLMFCLWQKIQINIPTSSENVWVIFKKALWGNLIPFQEWMSAFHWRWLHCFRAKLFRKTAFTPQISTKPYSLKEFTIKLGLRIPSINNYRNIQEVFENRGWYWSLRVRSRLFAGRDRHVNNHLWGWQMLGDSD